MPVFIFVSMVFHALLFLYAPQIITGLSPGLQKGDTEGLTFVTIIDVPEAIRTEAPRAEQVTPPRSTPNPEPRPTPEPPQPPVETRIDVTPPAPEVPDVQTVVTPPAPPVVEEPARAPVVAGPTAPTPPEVVVERPEPPSPTLTVPRGVEVTPAESAPPSPVQAVISTPPRPEPVAQEVRPSTATPTPQPQVVEAVTPPTPTPQPQVVETVTPPPPTPEPQIVETVTPPTPAPTPEPRVVETVTPPSPPTVVEREGPEEPGAITAAEPAPVAVAPPTGDTMAQAAGQFVYPKQAVDLLSQTVAVEVAVVVGTSGDVLDVVVVQSSGLAQIDEHASLLARHGMDYNTYDDVYELRVFVTYNHNERLMNQEVSDFFQSPPTVSYSPN